MANKLPPLGDLPFLEWVTNIEAKLTATPTSYGVLASDALELHGYVADLTNRMTIIENPVTRNKITIANKNVSKKSTLACARRLIKKINAYAPLTPGQREELRINPVDTIKTPIPAPDTRPMLMLASDGSFRVADETTPDKRTKPAGAQGCAISMKIDGPAPVTPTEAHLAVLATRNRGQLPVPPGSKGKTVWAIAQWYNERGELGPASDVVSVLIAA